MVGVGETVDLLVGESPGTDVLLGLFVGSGEALLVVLSVARTFLAAAVVVAGVKTK